MSELAKLSTRIDLELKDELDRFVRQTGMSQQHVIQLALAEWLEDAEDRLEVEAARSDTFEDWEQVKRELDL